MPSRFWAVSARICVSPTAPSVPPAVIASGRPALSRNTRPSRRSGSTLPGARRARPAAGSAPCARRCQARRPASWRTGVARPARGAAHEVLGALGVPRERVRDRLEVPVGRWRGDELDPGARLVVARPSTSTIATTASARPASTASRRTVTIQAARDDQLHDPRGAVDPSVVCDCGSCRAPGASDFSRGLLARRARRPCRCASSASRASARPARRRGSTRSGSCRSGRAARATCSS